MYAPTGAGNAGTATDVDQIVENKHQRQSMAFIGRLLLVVTPDLFEPVIASANLPTLNLFAASGVNGIVSLHQEDSQRRVDTLGAILQKHLPHHSLLPVQISRWLALLGYDDESILDEEITTRKFQDRADGMRSFVVASEPSVAELGQLLKIDVLESVPVVETIVRTALKAITDPDAKYDKGFVFLRSAFGSDIATRSRALVAQQEGERHVREVQALEDIDRVLENTLIPGLLESAELHGIEYAIAIIGDPYSPDDIHRDVRYTPLTITTLGAVKSALERASGEVASPKTSGAASDGRGMSKSASSLQHEHAQRRRRDSVMSFSFPECKWDHCGLGRLAVHDVWTALRRFLEHEALVCDSAPADGEEGDEAVLAVGDEEVPDEFSEDTEGLK